VPPQVAFEATPVEPIEPRAAEEPPRTSARNALQERWQLTGVVSANGARVFMLNDSEEEATVRLSSDGELDGWTIKDSGPDFAVLVQGEEEVLLVLNEGAAL
jgi:hypothetical protein